MATACLALTLAPAAFAAVIAPLAHIEVRGTGPTPVVLIPAYLFDWSMWEGFMERNKDRYTMYAVTLPGFGDSEAPARQPDEMLIPWLDNATEAIGKMIEEKGIKEPVVVGHSLGGHVALRLGVEWPDKVSKVVTVDGLPAYVIGNSPLSPAQRATAVNKELGPKFRAVNDDQWREQLGQMISGMVTSFDDAQRLTAIAAKTTRHAAVEYYLELIKSDITPFLFKMKRPTLAIAATPLGDEQTASPAERIKQTWRESLSGVDGAQIVFFEGSRQFVMYDMAPEFDKAISDFIEGKKVQGAIQRAKPTPVGPAVPQDEPGGVAPGATDKTKPKLLLPPSPKPGTKPR